jgi:hypothetical protein
MAIQSPSLSSSFSYNFSYDVFISFRGTDTRFSFTGNLYKALSNKGIRTFIDEKELQKGDEITPSLLKNIEDSTRGLPLLSFRKTMLLLHFVWMNLSTSFTTSRQGVALFFQFSMASNLLMFDIIMVVMVKHLTNMKQG